MDIKLDIKRVGLLVLPLSKCQLYAMSEHRSNASLIAVVVAFAYYTLWCLATVRLSFVLRVTD